MFSTFKKFNKEPITELCESRNKINLVLLRFYGKRKIDRNREENDFHMDDMNDETEADFINFNQSYKEHKQEIRKEKDKEVKLIVKQKYFSQKSPNFLTWSEKEQIRFLHQSDPEHWTIENLSKGFPAIPEVIKKILKSSWTKQNANKITNHDNSVRENWKLFYNGKMNHLPLELKQHLNNFKGRKIKNCEETNPLEHQKSNIKKGENGEFSEIIKSYERLKNNSEKSHLPIEQPAMIDYKKVQRETYLLTPASEFENRKHVQMKFSQKENKIDTIPNNLFKKQKETNVIKEDEVINKVDIDNYPETAVIVSEKEKDYSHLIYPDKIKIPGNIKKNGCVYKLKDCYYDDKGDFLYRVPGMY